MASALGVRSDTLRIKTEMKARNTSWMMRLAHWPNLAAFSQLNFRLARLPILFDLCEQLWPQHDLTLIGLDLRQIAGEGI